MFSASTFWITAAICLAAGFAGGWVLRRLFDPVEQKLRAAELHLEEAQAALRDYKLQVTAHFNGTAERVNRLTEDYRELHQHLSDGALVLCEAGDPAQQPPLLTSLGDRGYADEQNLLRAQPLDYAPVNSAPGKPSALSRSKTDEMDIERFIVDE